MIALRIVAMFICSFLLVKPALSQALPSSISITSDADGDGYGWRTTPHVLSATAIMPTLLSLMDGVGPNCRGIMRTN